MSALNVHTSALIVHTTALNVHTSALIVHATALIVHTSALNVHTSALIVHTTALNVHPSAPSGERKRIKRNDTIRGFRKCEASPGSPGDYWHTWRVELEFATSPGDPGEASHPLKPLTKVTLFLILRLA
eukprot:7075746-Pyramimonas_sp.AAC.1